MKTSELIEEARARSKAWLKIGMKTDAKMYQSLADRLENEIKTNVSYWAEISEWTKLSSQLENALNKACTQLERYSNGNTSTTEWKEWALRGDTE